MTFWNKVQSGVSRAAAEAEKQARITRLNLQIGEAQNAVRHKEQELGAAALKLARAGKLSDPTIDPIVQSIEDQEKRLTELREQLAEMQSGGSQPTASP